MAFKNKTIFNPKTGQGIKFLQTAKDTDGALLEMESTYHSHSKEPVPHYHPFQDEDFEVTSGELTIRMNGAVQLFRPGDAIHIPRGTVHSMWNNSDGVTVINWKVRPALNMENLLETGMGLANDGRTNEDGLPGILQVAIMANKYSDAFRLAKPPFIVQKILFALLTPLAYALGYRGEYDKYLD
jgi:quercetin dioxygenase-like cupin family protein